ncbi:hypothetical protein [Streptomyces alkaliterrae]|uniref:Uncharacterized protein n=1 Tax=Streptomyces alkaliterrae TaxID=2213162 RepID=A0A5P0YYL3_9ACTN|nr:hypothetical protein [Streptomyces alkaliterrae]MBB1256976.1 hypothetical protein [Streptomyces alkaliterrae]MBB1262439.1 hypothetical protein [Streptomyces alkaliterrae]MQS05371.1 hypothetical protein [Streptomyces alkaliterrae]
MRSASTAALTAALWYAALPVLTYAYLTRDVTMALFFVVTAVLLAVGGVLLRREMPVGTKVATVGCALSLAVSVLLAFRFVSMFTNEPEAWVEGQSASDLVGLVAVVVGYVLGAAAPAALVLRRLHRTPLRRQPT